jgi:hypothetical protein
MDESEMFMDKSEILRNISYNSGFIFHTAGLKSPSLGGQLSAKTA